MAYSLNDFIYSQKLRFYNLERRENVGATLHVNGDGKYVWENEGATLQKFLFNPSEDFDMVVCSFANGVTIRAHYDHTTLVESTNAFSCDIYFDMYDSEGDKIDSVSSFGGSRQFAYEYCSLTSAYFMYSPPGFNYDSYFDPSDHPNNFTSGGVIFTPAYYSLLSTYPIDISGNISEEKATKNWTRTANYLGFQTFDDFMNTIIENGDDTPITPILLEDDTSGPGGGQSGDPSYDPFSDPVDFPGLPSGGSSIATGFIRVYNPSSSQLQSLAGVLWSDSFIDTIKKIQNDPMEAIISLHSVPIGLVGSNAECRIGNFNSGVTMPAISQQFYTIDMGSIFIPEHWASALDYTPYVTVDCFIPFVGVVPLQVDDIVGKNIHIKYNIDILSGATVVSIMCNNSVLYTYNTNVIMTHPISQSSYGPRYQAILGAIGNTISGATQGGIGGAVGGAVGSGINVALSKQSNISRGGVIGGATGCLGSFRAYLIIHRPIQSLASNFAHFKGYPSNISTTLNNVSGYTEVEHIHLDGITCTDSEKSEIEALLYNGVIL